MCFLSKKHFEIEKIFDFISKSDFRNERVFENFVSKTSISKQNFEKAFRKKFRKNDFEMDDFRNWISKIFFEKSLEKIARVHTLSIIYFSKCIYSKQKFFFRTWSFKSIIFWSFSKFIKNFENVLLISKIPILFH